MIKTVLFVLNVSYFSQLCLASGGADEAEKALDNLRQTVIDNLNAAYDEQTKIAVEFDVIALDAKTKASEDVSYCVEEEVANTVDQLQLRSYDLIDMSLLTLYDVQKQIIVCGRADEDCLHEAVVRIGDIAETTPATVADVLEKTREYVKQQVELINACSDKFVKKKND